MISVCMITYNHESYIAQAIESIVCQVTDETFELVIGEDCSTDKTREICESYQEKYPDIVRLLPSKNNLGAMPNLVRVLEACQGEYVAFCEGDDYWTRESKIQEQADSLMSSIDEVKAHACNVEFYDERSKSRRSFGKETDSDYTLDDILFSWPYHLSSLMIKSNSFDASDLSFLSTVYSGDKFMNLILATKGVIQYRGTFKTGVYRRHSEGLSAKTDFLKKMDKDLVDFEAFRSAHSELSPMLHRAMFVRCQSGLTDSFKAGIKIRFKQKMKYCKQLTLHFLKSDKRYFKGLVYYIWKVIRS
jgi:glycosyltransferase involved in cell wall biosynthesis